MKNKSIRTICMCSVFFMLGGCVSAKFTKTGVFQPEKRAPDCDVAVFTSAPKSDYKEIGFIEFQPGAVSIKTAKSVAPKYVCGYGGNAILLLGAVSKGAFTSATVLHVEPEQKTNK